MTSKDLKARIEGEIGGDWSHTNLHGCDLKRCLVEPVLRSFDDAIDPSMTLQMWLVLEEIPESGDGYKIVYDDRSGMFGLACRIESGRDLYLGPYGDRFLEAYDAM